MKIIANDLLIIVCVTQRYQTLCAFVVDLLKDVPKIIDFLLRFFYFLIFLRNVSFWRSKLLSFGFVEVMRRTFSRTLILFRFSAFQQPSIFLLHCLFLFCLLETCPFPWNEIAMGYLLVILRCANFVWLLGGAPESLSQP